MQHGANINAYCDSKGDTALFAAIKRGNHITVEVLLELGADVELFGLGSETPLVLAVSKGFANIARLLLEAGAKVNATNGCYDTALIAAARTGDQGMVEMLLDHGADIDAGRFPFRLTATNVASRQEHAGILQLLSNHKRNPAGISELLSNHERNPETPSPRYRSAIDAEMLARIEFKTF